VYNRIPNQNRAGSFTNVATIRENSSSYDYVEENVNDILTRKENMYEGWLCWSGQESLFINANGDVYNATCKQYKLGNIYTDFEIPTEPVICTKKWCACAADLNTSKALNDEVAKMLRVNNGQ
jgi:hypothetical protein